MSMGGGGNPQLQEVAQQIEEIEQQQEAIEEEIERLQEEKQDIDEATEAIQELETGSTVQVPVGGDAYVRATIEDIDEIVVSLGGGYAAERDQDGAADTLETKKETVDERIEGLRSDIAELETESEKLEERAQEMQAQQLQQMQQQQQDE